MTPGALLLLAALASVGAAIVSAKLTRLWLGLTVASSIAMLAAAVLALSRAEVWDWRSPFTVGGEELHLRVDALNALFLALLAVVGGLGAVFARGYWPDLEYPASAPRGRLWWNGFVLGQMVVLTASNGLHFLFGWELFTVAAYFLITLDRQRSGVRAAGWLYLAASHVGTLSLFAFFASLAARTGSWELEGLRDRADLAPLFWLALFGFGVKAGVFPLHFWLPSAHANAPSHVSAVLSGVALKSGIYGILRFSGALTTPPSAGWVVIALGAIGALLGIAFALAQNDFKRLLAYCSVENVGVILIGVGGAMLAAADQHAAWGRLALAGALLHVWNHGAFKALLFFGAGSVLHATGTREMSRLGGMWRAMPWTASLFAVGAIAACGLPPLNGFVSEWLIYLGLFDASAYRGSAAWAAMPAALMLATGGALALASFVKASASMFLGSPRSAAAREAHECGPWMRTPMVILAILCVVLAWVPALSWPAISRVVEAWNPAWKAAPTAAPLWTIGFVSLGLTVIAVSAAALLWRRVRRLGVRRELTWDCGFVAPTARMQYTSGSFAAIASQWFGWILRPRTQMRAPRGLFPTQASYASEARETVLESVITPLATWVVLASTFARRLQHGRLQAYILYLVVGLVVLSAIVWIATLP